MQWRGGNSRKKQNSKLCLNVSHVEQELLTLPGFSGVRFLVFCVMFCGSLFVLLVIVLSVLRFMASDYPFGIFKLFLKGSVCFVFVKYDISITYVPPFLLKLFPFQVVIVLKAIQYEPLTMGSYVYPDWGNVIGWLIVLFPIVLLPGWFVYHLLFKDNTRVSCHLLLHCSWNCHLSTGPVVVVW